MPSEAWESLPPHLKQQMYWLAARMTAHRMNLGMLPPVDQLRVLGEAILRPSSVARKRIPRSSSPMPATAQSSVSASTQPAHTLHTVPQSSASTTWTDARLTSCLVVDEMPRSTRLDNVYDKWKRDPEFKHLRDNANFVPGDGKWPNPDVILIGEAPGADEDRLLRPFSGRSGNMLDGMLWEAGLKRADCFITNVVKWRPPKNRTPTILEVENSIPYLRRELMVTMPTGGIVITLGAVPLSVVDQDLRIGKVHGQPFTRGLWTFVPMYHPAFILRQWQKRREEYKSDWNKIKELIASDAADNKQAS